MRRVRADVEVNMELARRYSEASQGVEASEVAAAALWFAAFTYGVSGGNAEDFALNARGAAEAVQEGQAAAPFFSEDVES